LGLCRFRHIFTTIHHGDTINFSGQGQEDAGSDSASIFLDIEGKVTAHSLMGPLVLLAKLSRLGRRATPQRSQRANDDPLRVVERHLSWRSRDSLNTKIDLALESVEER
jgi:hypothetical protein